MRPFNIDEALKGAKICTRDGDKAILVKFYSLDNSLDAKIMLNRRYMKINYGANGSFHGDLKISSPYDLMMEDGRKEENHEQGER